MNIQAPFIHDELADLEAKGLKRSLRKTGGPQSRTITIEGREVLNFCSNNYLGLADDPRIIQAAMESARQEGFGSGASRLVGGNMESHRKLEEAIARHKQTEGCLFFSSGYMANTGVIPALFGRDDIIFSDKLNHASIIDGILLSRAECRRYPHKDMEALEEMLKSSADFRRRLIVTDTVFSMDGDCAPLREIVDLAEKYEAIVMVDEAHALGVLGARGCGLVEHLGLEGRVHIQMGTLSKAAGTFGAYVCGSNELIELLINRARSFVFTTGLPPMVAAAGVKAIEIIVSEPERRQKLFRNAEELRHSLKSLRFDTLQSETPIIPIVVKDSNVAATFSKKLLERGIFVQAIRPPTVPANTARLRLTVMATHTPDDLKRLIEAVEAAGKDLCLI